MQKIISFPHMGNYHVPIEIMLKLIFKDHIIKVAPKITTKTLELGSKHSPDFVCVPFKYTLGNFIEALDMGANVLVQAGGGCRYGYYAEVQEQILKDMGYEFEFMRIIRDSINPFALYRNVKKIGTDISFYKFLYNLLLAIKMVKIIDEFETYIRENICFEEKGQSFEKIQKQFLSELKFVKSFKALKLCYKKYLQKIKNIKLNKRDDFLRVGIVGELYSLMEPFCNCFIEKELAKYKIQVSRYITVSFLLFEKGKNKHKILKGAGKYLKYEIGADGTDSVERSKMMAEKGYDGIIHLKPFGCIPEINAMPMLQNISNDYNIPIIYFSFDSQTSETGVKTRLEAFHDMLLMRKESNVCKKVI